MREFLESHYGARIVQWNEPEDDLGGAVFSAYIGGIFLRAESVALLVSALQEAAHQPFMLAA